MDRRARVAVLGVALVVIALLGLLTALSLNRCAAGCPAGNASAPSVVATPGVHRGVSARGHP
jgi:hypothetical protein